MSPHTQQIYTSMIIAWPRLHCATEWKNTWSVIRLLTLGTILLLGAPLESMAISVSPATLSFSSTQGNTPPAQTVTFWKGGDRSKHWSVSATTPWVTVTPASGTIATERDQIDVSVNTTGLSTGSYTSSVIISTESFRGRTVKTVIPLSLSVSGVTGTTPAIRLTPSALSFSGVAGGVNPAAQLLSLSNPTGGTLSWSLTSNATWLNLSTASGTTTTETDSISASVNLTGLAAGTYTAAIAVSAAGATNTPQVIPVSLTVNAAPTTSPAIGLSQTNLAFTGTAGGTNPTNQSFTISNTGGGTLTWTAGDNASWLTLSPITGTNTGTVTTSVNLTGLAAGTYSGTITVAATGATSKTLAVTLTVNAPTSTAGFTVSPSNLSYAGTVGGPTVVAGVTITNTGSAPLTVTWYDPINWLVATSGDTVTMAPGGTATITHTASTAGLSAGIYTGTATISGGGVTKQVPITFTISSSTSTPVIGFNVPNLALTGTAGGTNPATQSFTVSNTGGGTLTWTASDSATWLTLSPASGTNTGTIAASVNLTGLAAGTYSGTITVAATGATSKTIPVSLTVNPTTTTATTAATITWAANTEIDLAGYKIYVGTQSGVYSAPITVGPVTTYQLTNLQKSTTYFISITAVDTAGNESLHSVEVSKSIF